MANSRNFNLTTIQLLQSSNNSPTTSNTLNESKSKEGHADDITAANFAPIPLPLDKNRSLKKHFKTDTHANKTAPEESPSKMIAMLYGIQSLPDLNEDSSVKKHFKTGTHTNKTANLDGVNFFSNSDAEESPSKMIASIYGI